MLLFLSQPSTSVVPLACAHLSSSQQPKSLLGVPDTYTGEPRASSDPDLPEIQEVLSSTYPLCHYEPHIAEVKYERWDMYDVAFSRNQHLNRHKASRQRIGALTFWGLGTLPQFSKHRCRVHLLMAVGQMCFVELFLLPTLPTSASPSSIKGSSGEPRK